MKLAEFAALVKGSVTGDAEAEITGVAGIKEAGPGDITFIASSKFMKHLATSRASCVIVAETTSGAAVTQLKVSNPYYAFAKAIECLHPRTEPLPVGVGQAVVAPDASLGSDVRVFPNTYISEGVSVGDRTVIYPGVFIGRNVKIGSDCVIHANVTIREECRLGSRVIVHAGTVIGSDGFGYVPEGGIHYKIPQVGKVVIEDDVEIGSNVSIDRATLGETVVGKGTKIDNLVQVAHNVKIGEHCIVVGQVGISGSCDIGDRVTIAGQAGIADHTTIDSEVIIGGRTATMGGHLTKGFYLGAPATPHREFLRAQSLFMKLPEMSKKLKELEDRLTSMEKETNKDASGN